jgi:hypothetical protein
MPWETFSNNNKTGWWCNRHEFVANSMYPPGIYTLATQAEAEMWCDIFNADPQRAEQEIEAWGKPCG